MLAMLLLANKLKNIKSRQHKLIAEINNFTIAEAAYRRNLRRFLARLEAHKQDYLFLGIKLEMYNELYFIIASAIKISQRLESCLRVEYLVAPKKTEDVKFTLLDGNMPVVVNDFSVTNHIDDSVVVLVAVKERITEFVAEMYNKLELQEMFFSISKVVYLMEYLPDNFKTKDTEIIVAAMGDTESALACKIDNLGKLIKFRFDELTKFIRKAEDMGLGIEAAQLERVLVNSDSIVKFRVTNNEIERSINLLKKMQAPGIKYVDAELKKNNYTSFKKNRDALRGMVLQNIATNAKEIVDDPNVRQAIIKKIISILQQAAAYYRLNGEEHAAGKFQKAFIKEIQRAPNSAAAAAILHELLTSMDLKHSAQLVKNIGVDKIAQLARQNYNLNSWG